MSPVGTEEKKQGFGGLRVVGFESRRALEMQSLIERHGGNPLVAPSMREIPFEINQEAIEFAKRVLEGQADVVILLTGNGARFLLQGVEARFPRDKFLNALAKTTLVARGPKPVAVLREWGLKPSFTAPEPNTWKEVLAVLDQNSPVKDKRVFVQEYGAVNPPLIEGLKQRGARVSRVPVYRWALPEDWTLLRRAIQETADGQADVLLFTNATQVHHVLRVAAEDGLEPSFREALDRTVVASIGPVASETLRENGLPVDFEPTKSVLGIFVKEAAERCAELAAGKRGKARGKLEVRSYPARSYDRTLCQDSPFLKACRSEPVPYTPVWLMRQAGRYMKEYRDLRSRVGFLELCKNSDLCCEVTVTAQERLRADAAILFSDILLIVEPMGVGLEYSRGDGPCIHRPVRTGADVDAVREVDPEESLAFVMEAVRKARSALKGDIPLIGFAGAPFTVVSYMVEGKGSDHYLHTKTLMYREPEAWHRLMEKVTAATARHINAQIRAGAQAAQIFDSWIGCLSPGDYRRYVLPHMKRLFAALEPRVPAIHFGTDTAALLELMKEAGGTVIGLDWRVPFGATRDRLGKTAVQGNLDPLVLLSDVKTIRARVKEILEENAGRPGHIFNLGHGVLPQTPVENALALVDIVHDLSGK